MGKRLSHRRVWAAAVLTACCLLSTAALSDDTVILNDGNMYSGKITWENAAYVEIETKVANIPTKLKIERGRIASIVRNHEGWANEPDKQGEGQEPAGEQDTRTRVMEIPLKGTFGEDILPIGFRASLEYADRNDVEHVVLRINSGGGYLWAGIQIADIMQEYRGKITFHALIENSISASIWPTFMCETIHMAPSGTFGGAVIYHVGERGSAEVDAKFNSITAAQLVAAAEPLGHDGDVIRAMILMPSELYLDTTGDTPQLTGGAGSGGYAFSPQEHIKQVDSSTTVLTLTTKDAAEYGIAGALLTDSLEELVSVLKLGEWKQVEGGSGLMERWNNQCEQRRALAETSAKRLVGYVEELEAAKDIDTQLDILMKFQREHPRFANYLRDYRECFPDVEMDIEPKEVRELTQKVRDLIAELRKAKRQSP